MVRKRDVWNMRFRPVAAPRFREAMRSPSDSGRAEVHVSHGQLPLSTTSIRHVTFPTCPNSDLTLACVKHMAGGMDDRGVYEDSWWRIRSRGVPDRYFRLQRGARSLWTLLSRYAFLDADLCVHQREFLVTYGPVAVDPPRFHHSLLDCPGVPQFTPTSGVCWFASLCWVSFGNARVSELIRSHMPRDMAADAARCLKDCERARALRNRLWDAHAIGDDVRLGGEHDGQNGAYEFRLMCAALGVPLITIGGNGRPETSPLTNHAGQSLTPAPIPQDGACLLLITTIGRDPKDPIHRLVTHGGRRYRLGGWFGGSTFCGHQIGACFPGTDLNYLSIADADTAADIGAMHCEFKKEHPWYESLLCLFSLTLFGPGRADICPLTPHNVGNRRFDPSHSKRGSKESRGSLAVDLLYYCPGACPPSSNGKAR